MYTVYTYTVLCNHITVLLLHLWTTRGPQRSAVSHLCSCQQTAQSCYSQSAVSGCRSYFCLLSRNPSSYVQRLFEKPWFPGDSIYSNHRAADWCFLTPEDWVMGKWEKKNYAISINIHCFSPFILHSFIQNTKNAGLETQTEIWKEKKKYNIKADRRGLGDRLERLNPRSKRQIGRGPPCSSTGRTNVVNITNVSGFCPIGASNTETCTQGFCCKAYVIDYTRPPEATWAHTRRFGLGWSFKDKVNHKQP